MPEFKTNLKDFCADLIAMCEEKAEEFGDASNDRFAAYVECRGALSVLYARLQQDAQELSALMGLLNLGPHERLMALEKDVEPVFTDGLSELNGCLPALKEALDQHPYQARSLY
jgi:hypothetical protein